MNTTFPSATTCRRWTRCLALFALLAGFSMHAAEKWQAVPGNIMTRWAKDVNPAAPHPEYPRPTMVREQWQNLNGLWDYAIVPTNAPTPTQWAGKILVPFPIESALSGVKQMVGAKNRLWYRRTFTVPGKWRSQRVMLNFGAVDWEAVVSVNGRQVGTHRGGYDGFSFDITDALKPRGEQELVVSVWDPNDDGPQPRGKQVKKAGGIWYTPTTGIWQTPWLEPVNETYIKSLRITPNVDNNTVTIDAGSAKGGYTVEVTVRDGGTRISSAKASAGERVTLPIKNPKLWTPEKPHLYRLEVKLKHGWSSGDSVESYFGMRKIALAKDDQSVLRMQLNNQTLFQLGPLDQGFWPDGLYTAPTDEALRWDIEQLKKLGFNMARKHVKVEPERWYYWCDKLGLLVWQDMPSGDKSARWQGPSGFDGEEMKRTPESAAIYEREWKAIIDARYNHPCIVTWVPFNEGWGQFDTVRILNWTKQYDPTRLVDGASGGNHFPAGDILDHHQYPGPGAPKRVTDRAMVLGEFGGLGLPVKGHTWQEEKNWGYRSFTNSEALTEAYVRLTKKLHPMIRDHGLSAAIYTQTTDVEVEVNGLFTYDRQIVKMDEARIVTANRKLYGPAPPAPRVTVLSPTSKDASVEWAYTFTQPAMNWAATDFDDSAWPRGPGGFGTKITPNSVVRTEWNGTNIWLRRAFEAPANFKAHDLQLNIFHDEDARVYLNGHLIAELSGYVGNYETVPLDSRAVKALKPGRNLLAVVCRQTRGGQYIDVGLEDADESASATATGSSVDSQTQSAAQYSGAMVQATTKQGVTVPVPNAKRAGLYVQNRAPLTPAPFMKLPIGAIQPRGWLRHQLALEAGGMVGRLAEISPWLNFSRSSWAAADGSGNYGWEEMPYWLKGCGDLAYVLKDEKLLAETKRWIEAILKTQREDGYYGPRNLLTSLNGQPDLWPHMLVNNILQSWHEYSGDQRVIPFLLKYHRWLHAQPDSTFANGYWPRIRWGDNVETCHWLYNRTGEKSLLELAERIHRNMAAWRDGIINWHNVNLAQGFREPGVFFTQSGAARDLAQAEANYVELMGTYGQFAGGGFGGDENCRPGFTDPRQGFETCGMVEFMHSFEMLTKISGDVRWADRAEEVAFNSLPAAITPDWKGLHYLTCPNQIQLDRHNKSPAVENGGTMFSYSPFEVYRCCQHNVSHGWPYYAEELWLATADHGLAASLYAASEVTAKVGKGTEIRIVEETDYPFGESVTLKLSTPKAVKFPLHLRIPQWAAGAKVQVNGAAHRVEAKPSTFAVIEREWKNGDVVVLTLPMKIATRTWAKNQNAVSVDYGPLTFSLKIGERWEKYGNRRADWPEYEVFPTTPWNYALELDTANPAKSFELVRRPGPLAKNPFTQDTAPLELRAKARRVPAWQADRLNVVGKLQPSPVKTSEPIDTVSLIPMGAARLRITSFPVAGKGPAAREWTVAKAPPVTASHTSFDSVEAMIDGIEPKNSNDHNIPRFTWWDHRGTKEWVEWGFEKPKPISEVSVYWFDDTGRGQCRVPESWQVLYRAGERWLPVEDASAFGTVRDQFNRVTFKPVSAEGLRLEVQLQPNVSSGILEWKAK